MYLHLVIIATILVNCGVQVAHTFPVRDNSTTTATILLFEDINFRGIQVSYELGQSCVNIQGRANDRTSSVDTKGDCFLLYEHTNCRGRFHRANQTIDDLSSVNFNDSVSSLRRCSENDTQNRI